MNAYCCNKCDMKINDLTCGKCQEKLKPEEKDCNGKKVCVCACPNGCGQVKSPQCCGQDMQAKCCDKNKDPNCCK